MVRVDLFGDLHRADLRGEGRARTTRHHDGGHQHAELAHRDPPDQVDSVDLGAELGELDRSLLGYDDAYEEAHQADDSERSNAHYVEAGDDRIEPEPSRGPADDVGKADQDRAEKGEQADQGRAHLRHPLPKLGEHSEEAGLFVRMDLHRLVKLADLLQKAHFITARTDDLRVAITNGAVDNPRPNRVHALDFREVDG